jgi:hypothetical protein
LLATRLLFLFHFLPRLKDAANKQAAGSETSSQVVNVNATTREREMARNYYIVQAAVHATNDAGVIMHASSASGAGHWISALIFFAFDIGTPLFHASRRRLVCPDEESTHQDYRTRYASFVMYSC